MDKWKTLREWHELPAAVARYMDELEIEQHKDGKPHEEGFLYVGTPKFDQKSKEKILEEMGLQGLA